jgi:hypothetical protein
MRFDLSGCGAGLDESSKSLLELDSLAESLGYDGLWINEEHFGQGSRVCLSRSCWRPRWPCGRAEFASASRCWYCPCSSRSGWPRRSQPSMCSPRVALTWASLAGTQADISSATGRWIVPSNQGPIFVYDHEDFS